MGAREIGEGIETAFSGEICVVRLKGDLADHSQLRICRLVEAIDAHDGLTVLIDASLLHAISEGCSTALREFGQAVTRRGGTVTAYGAHGAAMAALTTIGS